MLFCLHHAAAAPQLFAEAAVLKHLGVCLPEGLTLTSACCQILLPMETVVVGRSLLGSGPRLMLALYGLLIAAERIHGAATVLIAVGLVCTGLGSATLQQKWCWTSASYSGDIRQGPSHRAATTECLGSGRRCKDLNEQVALKRQKIARAREASRHCGLKDKCLKLRKLQTKWPFRSLSGTCSDLATRHLIVRYI